MENPLYLWIIRCAGGGNINRNLEYKLIDEAPNDSITPLVEIINESHLYRFYRKLKIKYGEVWVDLPYYLAEESNSFQDKVNGLKSRYISNPRSFFIRYQNALDVPVVSAPLSYAFDSERNIYNSIKADFDKIAVRVRVPIVDITSLMEDSLKKLVNEMRIEDILLLDVFRFSAVEPQVVSNIERMNKIVRKNNIRIYILNAFETNQPNCHNYDPLLTAYFSMTGFGDFATEERFKATATRGARTRIIRYYEPSSYNLWFFTESISGYEGAKRRLVNSGYWANTSTPQHRTRCVVCYEVNINRYKKDHIYWKRFKMLHYLSCLVNETATQFSTVNTPEDLDPDGYATIVKSGER